MSGCISLRKTVEITGLHPNTLRKYADNGTIPHYRQPNGGHRMFDVSKFVRTPECVIGYARVSRPIQKQDLERQKEVLRLAYPEAEVIADIGSGLNFKRKGLLTVLERLLRGDRVVLVLTYRDRLARFGFDLIRHLVERNGGKIVVLNQIDTSPEQELVGDLTAIITVFSSRLHGLRSHKNKKAVAAAIRGTESDSADA